MKKKVSKGKGKKKNFTLHAPELRCIRVFDLRFFQTIQQRFEVSNRSTVLLRPLSETSALLVGVHQHWIVLTQIQNSRLQGLFGDSQCAVDISSRCDKKERKKKQYDIKQ